MKNIVYNTIIIRWWCLLVALFFIQMHLFSQVTQTITGTIFDEDNEPLIGATVLVKGTSQGTTTDLDGMYKMEGVTASDTLVFSYTGFQVQEIAVGDKISIDVILSHSLVSLDEIVVIGYGTAKKSDLTGSVASVAPERLVDRPVPNVGKALQNKVSGVQVILQAAGEPGSRPQVRIRGTNSINTNSEPLFVVDGIVGMNNALYSLDPNDIISMDVLKDASATAIYGTRGANGVVIIKTKRGEAGRTRVNYSGSLTRSIMTRHNYTVTADQFMYLYEQAFRNTPKYGTLNSEKDYRGGDGTGLSWSEMPHLFEQVPQGSYFMDFIGNDGNYYRPRFYSDWEDYAFNPAWSYNNHIDISGGSEKARLSLSLGQVDQNGLMIESWYKRYNAKASADIEISKWLSASANINYSNANKSRGDDQTRTISETWPILPPKYPDDPAIYGIYAGDWSTGRDFPVGENWRNILYVMDQQGGYYQDNQITSGIILTAQITPNLSFKTDFAIDNRSYDSRWARGNYQGSTRSEARASNEKWSYWQTQNYFDYNQEFGDHSFTGLVGLAWSKDIYNFLEARAYNFSSNFYSYNNLGAGTDIPNVSSNNTEGALNSYFARFNYGYKNKYLLTLTGRVDGSSKFGENNKYAFFPSMGIAWKISQEDFMASSNVISDLKLRASVGQTGNQEIGSFVTQSFINNTSVYFGDSKLAALYPGSTGNPDLKWETTTQYDLGIDLGLFNNRINLVFDFYYKKTTDQLFRLPLPRSTTTGEAWVNFGAVENRGFEIDLFTRNMVRGTFTWNSHFTLSFNRNRILELGPTGADVFLDTGAGNATSVYRVGSPIGSFFGLNRIGVWSTMEAAEAARYGRVPGDLKFEDVNQDGKIELISDGDIIGNAYPKFYGGFSNEFKYGRFDANINIQFLGGVNKAIVHESAEDRQFVSGMVNTVLNAWRPDHQGPEVQVAQVRAGNAGARYDSYSDTHQMYDASFIRGSSAALGYSFKPMPSMER
ncbi:MAG: TonB-dependent receptor, partial [Saprospiraceae bacterium]|nr:TonB-dependent receptor [Saprospiraceae bacterium]